MGTISIQIDGKVVLTRSGKNLLQVARENGIDIPGLCFHPRISPTGACRLCSVKINGQDTLTMACTVSVDEGLTVTAFDEELEQNRRQTLEYLVAEHNNEDDGTYQDELRDLVKRYEIDIEQVCQTIPLKEDIIFKTDTSSPVLSYDASKCINCFRCVKGCSEIQGKEVLAMNERGLKAHIIAGFDQWDESECDGCGECIQICPTGAIVEKPHHEDFLIDQVDRTVKTTCPYCGVGCQLELLVKDNTIVRSNGVEFVSPNYGRLCVKGRFGYDFVASPERLTQPLIKKNGVFEKASWDEALELIAQRFRTIKEKNGSSALAGYSSAKCTNEDNYLFQKFIRTVFQTNNIDYCTRLCHASTVTAMIRAIGDGAGSNSIEDFETSDVLFIIGNNIIETHPVTATFVKRGKTRGNKIIVCDPKWTPMVKYADIWLQPKLGTDVALLNGIIHIIIKKRLYDETFIKNRVKGGLDAFQVLMEQTSKYTPEKVAEITGVPIDLLEAAATIYASSTTAIIATGMGMSQQVTGTNNVFALINMMLITGQVGKERAGINPPRGQNNVQGATDVGASPVFYPGYIPVTDTANRKKVAKVWNIPVEELDDQPGLTTVELMKAAYDGKIKGIYVLGENPMITDPNLNHAEEAFKRMDLVVVQDIFFTETAAMADVVLPATSFAEKDGTFVNSDRRVLRVRKTVDPPGEAWNDWTVLCELAKRMGRPFPEYKNSEAVFTEIRKVTPMLAGITYQRIEDQGIQWPCPDETHPGTGTLFTERFNTSDGKAVLHPVDYVSQGEKPSEEFPFILNSGRILYHYHSATMSKRNNSLNAYANRSYLLMHPRDAQKNELMDGDTVKVNSRRGTLVTWLKISEEVLPGELFMPWHYSHSQVNRLTRDELDPFSKIAPFKLTACRVDKTKETQVGKLK
jgi:formate dehydrogenase alpha subunit